MSFYSDKESVFQFAELFIQKGLEHIVVSPGSRNAPLALTLASYKSIQSHVIVDERSAAFYALGLAQQTKKAVAVICTSGSAVMNYMPAVVEAHYQKIPLVIVSADRPEEWIDQNDGQTIRQKNVFGDFVNKSVHIPQQIMDDNGRWYSGRLINEALNAVDIPQTGPVHINFPFLEPLYGKTPKEKFKAVKQIKQFLPLADLAENQWKELREDWEQSGSTLILCGMNHPNPIINKSLNKIGLLAQVSLLSESTSNLFGEAFNPCIDNLLFNTDEIEEAEKMQPELLITFGGQIVSKKIKAFLRKNKAYQHWHVGTEKNIQDTYQSLTHHLQISPETFFSKIIDWSEVKTPYKSIWKKKHKLSEERHRKFLLDCPFSDLKVFEAVLQAVPEKTNLQMGNSTPIRYQQLFCLEKELYTYANRGTSGIDGTVSTAVGAAKAVPKKPTVLITGELAFFYDSNGLWLEDFPENLKIIIINNGGGGIFRIIEGPEKNDLTKRFLESRHKISAEGIAQTFGISYAKCSDLDELELQLKILFSTKKASILEVFTPTEVNDKVLKAYIHFLRFGVKA